LLGRIGKISFIWLDLWLVWWRKPCLLRIQFDVGDKIWCGGWKWVCLDGTCGWFLIALFDQQCLYQLIDDAFHLSWHRIYLDLVLCSFYMVLCYPVLSMDMLSSKSGNPWIIRSGRAATC
jgi:hypothetical protein